MKILFLTLIALFSFASLAQNKKQNWVYQVKESKIKGITLASYLDEKEQEHYKVGFFEGAKAFEKESITKSEFKYLVEYGERLKKGLVLSPDNSDCFKNLLVTQDHTTRICYKLTEEAMKDFQEWHEQVQKFTIGKEEKENLILKRHLKKTL